MVIRRMLYVIEKGKERERKIKSIIKDLKKKGGMPSSVGLDRVGAAVMPL